MSRANDPVAWVVHRHRWLLGGSILIMLAAPYLGSLPVRTIPSVVALASDYTGATSAELKFYLGDRAGELSVVLGFLVFAGALSFGLALLSTRVVARLSSLATRDLRLHLHDTMLRRPPDYLRQGNRANMVRTALLQQSRAVAAYATGTLPAAFGVFFGVAIWAHTLFTAVDSPGQRGTALMVVLGVVAFLLVVNLCAVWLAGKKTQQSQAAVMAEQGAFIGLAGESVDQLSALQLNLAQADQQERLRDVLERMSRAEVRVATWSGLSAAAGSGVVLLGIPLLVLAWRGLGLRGEQLAVMVPALLMLQRSISSVGSLWTSRKITLPSIKLMEELLVAEPTIDTVATGKASDGPGALAFEDVHWSADGRSILAGIDLAVEPGETVALVGKGGSGKSSLLRLALRVGDPDRGRIALDGTAVADMSLDHLRRRVGLLEQHPAIFARSVRDNLLLDGATRSDDEILAAATTARFREVIDNLPDGLDTQLGGTSGTLSGSERRRLALTRLLLREPSLIFIDELEAGLPQADAQALLRDVRAATRGKTCLMVTHRPDLMDADRVAFVHEGCIFDIATHHQLESRCEPYRALLAETRETSHE